MAMTEYPIQAKDFGWLSDDSTFRPSLVSFPMYIARASYLRARPKWRRAIVRLLVKSANALITAALFVLAACAGTPPIQTKIVEVSKPVAIQPITAAQIPPLPGPIGLRPTDARDGEAVALAARCDAIEFVLKAYPLLLVSAGLPPAQAPFYPECAKK